MNYCHVSRQIADHAEELGRQEEYDSFVDARMIELADTGSTEINGVTIDIADVIEVIIDDPLHEQAYMEVMQGNTRLLGSIMDRIARVFIVEAME